MIRHHTNNAADAAPHRDVDKYILTCGSNSLKTAIICPSTVYGPGRGPVSQRSDQIPGLTRLILQSGRGLQFADGKAFWNAVHVYDLSRLYVSFVEDAIASTSDGTGQGQGQSKATWNEEGYYLVESGVYYWGDVARRITSEAYKLGLLPSEEVLGLGVENRDILRPAGRPVTNYAVRAEAIRARRLLGWRPVEEGTLESEIPGIVRAEARALGLDVRQ
jgi:nucleoside-diphosphate-sugar epimerase